MSLAARDDTIAAIATAVAAGAGTWPSCESAARKPKPLVANCFSQLASRAGRSHRVLYGHVNDPTNGDVVDEVLLLLMRAPRSFTRETVVEFHGHGGLVAVQRLLDLVLAAGARASCPNSASGRFSMDALISPAPKPSANW